MAAGADDLDRRAVEWRQHLRPDHLVEGAERGVAPAEIEHPVDRAEKLAKSCALNSTVSFSVRARSRTSVTTTCC